ncbi:hypothetical protein BDV40DRAFT_313587 [Aspergillus tamarii]|uniref:N-acetyltransferase domain-containing protein n=1 Tax=Aspergillus tamarii TaxID=41984 RepID=A0A5N6UQS0_ASPTM|nr:hypothetical protein BDV40DRAFT_313587 [Aspergillus tamarii]
MDTVQFPGLAGLKAFVRPLDMSDLDSCVEVESAFPEQERCSREKFIYRLTVCPDICLGLFVENSGQVELVGHVIATRVPGNRVTDGAMERKALMDEYSEYARNGIEMAQSIVIIAYDHLIRFDESFGFKNLGPSPCTLSDEGWYDMLWAIL